MLELLAELASEVKLELEEVTTFCGIAEDETERSDDDSCFFSSAEACFK